MIEKELLNDSIDDFIRQFLDKIVVLKRNNNRREIQLDIYLKALDKTKGLIPEFVNPKYADETKTKFKSPINIMTKIKKSVLNVKN